MVCWQLFVSRVHIDDSWQSQFIVSTVKLIVSSFTYLIVQMLEALGKPGFCLSMTAEQNFALNAREIRNLLTFIKLSIETYGYRYTTITLRVVTH